MALSPRGLADGPTSPRPRYGSILDNERISAEEMDERRKQNVAYEYLCHLEETKRWLEACIGDDLPPTVDLEEGLRNGVWLAKLARSFAPDCVSIRRIYDGDQIRYKAVGLHFRHTDNIVQWLKSLEAVGLPKCRKGQWFDYQIFYPETTDIYDRKNMPKAIYCIHALSLYLFKLGIAPKIQDLYGKVDFTAEEIDNVRMELEKYGIQMPAFGKIGGLLTGELSVDEAMLHAAVIAVNEAVDRGVASDTLTAMQNPNAMLSGLDKSLAKLYQEALSQVKGEKAISAQNTLMTTAEREMYDDLLTHAEIQGNINRINLLAALEVVEDAIEQGDIEGLFAGLQCPSLGLSGLCHENVLCYLQKLSDARQCKTQKTDSLEPLNKEELQAVVMAANSEAWRDESKQKSLRLINRCIRQGNAKETVRGLMQAEADLPAVHEFAAELYQHDLRSLQDQRNMGELSHEELHVAVEMLSAVAVINQALERGLCPDAWALLTRPEVGIVHLESDNQRRYMNALVELKDERTAQGVKFLTWNDIQHCVESVNAAVEDEHD
uniref:ras GTPase-activating-like protein IQGAP1 n=1 Tax=Myxine glutinosa TaxID=7769 RepID=UPI00358E2876